MKWYIFVISLAITLVLFAHQGMSQQIIELKPPTDETITGVIKKIDDARKSIVIKRKAENQEEQEISIVLDAYTKVFFGQKTADRHDLSEGQAVRITYSSQNIVPIVNNIPVGEETIHIAKKITIVSMEKDEFSIFEIKPTLSGYKNNALLVATKNKVWVRCEDKPDASLVLARGGLWVRALTEKAGSMRYGAKGETIMEPGTEVLVCADNTKDDKDWFVGNIDYDSSTYSFVGLVRLLGYFIEGHCCMSPFWHRFASISASFSA